MVNVSTDKLLKSLGEYYQKGEYQKGVDTLLQNKSQLDAESFHFYLGNFFLKKGEIGAGRYNLEKAKLEGFNHSILENNIGFAKSQVVLRDFDGPDNPLGYLQSKVLSLGGEQILLACLLGLFLTFVLRKIQFIKSKAMVITLLLLSLLPVPLKYLYIDKIQFAIVLKSSTIHEGPSRIFTKIGELYGGEKLLISDYNEGWAYVKKPEYLNGWIKLEDLGLY
ncbi:MAG: hypothetical protein ACPGJV_03625 [Bacteriovoracaceae bacterium]